MALSNPAYQHTASAASATFHGRDIFAPAAAHLANGVKLDDFGPAVTTPVLIDLPQPRHVNNAIELRVIDIDHFGNLITNLPVDQLSALGDVAHTTITVGPARLHGIHHTFANVPVGEGLAYRGSSGRLEIAIRNGSAADTWHIKCGDAVMLDPAG